MSFMRKEDMAEESSFKIDFSESIISCGMEMDESLYGTHGDGHRNAEYCIHCFKDGLFTVSSMEEQIEINASPEGLEDFNKASGLSLSKDEAVQGLCQYLPTLKRWMEAEDQASWILDHTRICNVIDDR